jgi:hypothetical protein
MLRGQPESEENDMLIFKRERGILETLRSAAAKEPNPKFFDDVAKVIRVTLKGTRRSDGSMAVADRVRCWLIFNFKSRWLTGEEPSSLVAGYMSSGVTVQELRAHILNQTGESVEERTLRRMCKELQIELLDKRGRPPGRKNGEWKS